MRHIEMRDGFSLIEIIVAMMMLTVGILAMAGSTGYILRQLQSAEMRTARMSAVRDVAEGIRATRWDAIDDTCNTSTFTRGDYQVTCAVDAVPKNPKQIRIVSQGPGFSDGHLADLVADTFAITVARPQ